MQRLSAFAPWATRSHRTYGWALRLSRAVKHLTQEYRPLGGSARHASSEIKDLALLILEVARVKPHKRRRWKFLEQNHPELFEHLKALTGGEIPDADFSSLYLDISPTQHLDSVQQESARWEDDPYWLVDSED
jgi:hypothetical protein